MAALEAARQAAEEAEQASRAAEEAQIAAAKSQAEANAAKGSSQTSGKSGNSGSSSKKSTAAPAAKSSYVVSASESDVYLLSACLTMEANGGSYESYLAVGSLIVNRVKSANGANPSPASSTRTDSSQARPPACLTNISIEDRPLLPPRRQRQRSPGRIR